MRRENPFSVRELAGLELEMQTKRGTDEADPFRVNVTESYEPSANIYVARLELTPPADRIVHRYIPDAGRVRHIFIYENTTRLRTVQPKLYVTSRDRILRYAVVVEPLTVTLPRD